MEFVAEREDADLAEVDIAVVDSRQMAQLNRKYLKRSGPTDVLSFDLSDSPAGNIVAQLVICGEIAAQEARARHIGQQREILLYVLHGLLHVLGYDDQTDDAPRMFCRQEELLCAFLSRH